MTGWQYRGGSLPCDRTAVMGIVNITPDSFSDGGRFLDVEAAVAHALQLQEEGADLLDLGGQSTRPHHTPISEEEEWQRLQPVLARLCGQVRVPISVDTFYASVAQRALHIGAAIINDVSGSLKNGMMPLAARTGAGLVLMVPTGGSLSDARTYFETALAAARDYNLPPERICLDIGVGFGTTREQDFQRIAALRELTAGLPAACVLCGASRKRITGAFCGEPPAAERLAGTIALHTAAQLNGARVLRAHDVREAVQAARTIDAYLLQKTVDKTEKI